MAKNKPVPTPDPPVMKPTWPEGLPENTNQILYCDDKGAGGDAMLRVFVDGQGDVWLSMSAFEEWRPKTVENLEVFPTVRVRTSAGGGRMRRTRQVLLWLADAIRRDREELGPAADPMRRPETELKDTPPKLTVNTLMRKLREFPGDSEIQFSMATDASRDSSERFNTTGWPADIFKSRENEITISLIGQSDLTDSDD